MNQQTPPTVLDGSSIKPEVNIAVFALLMNFGYFKLSEISQFVSLFQGITNPTSAGEIVSIAIAGIFYLAFFLSVVLGVIMTLMKREVLLLIAIALLCVFGLYLVLMMRAFDSGLAPPGG